MNGRLKEALREAHISIDDIVEATGVDPKTVQRWLNGRIPHPRHRAVIARLLNKREDSIWSLSNVPISLQQSQEIVSAYAHRSQAPIEEWWFVFSHAQEHIDMLANAMLFIPEQHAGLMELLRGIGALGGRVRIALAEPESQMVRVRDEEEGLGGTLPGRIKNCLYHFREVLNAPGVEIKYHSTPLYNSLFRGDNEIIVTPHLYGLHGSKAPLLHIKRLEEDGLFENFLAHFEAVWRTTISLHDLEWIEYEPH
jgi:transcriptional regulator with XRE-family HTH domain